MTGIQFVTDNKGNRVAVQFDLKQYKTLLEEVWDGLLVDSRRGQKTVPYDTYRAKRAAKKKRDVWWLSRYGF
jgi:hypothetical protein